MKVIISPAKKMITDEDNFEWKQLPEFLDRTEELLQYLKKMSFMELQRTFKCSEELTELNLDRFKTMELKRNLTPAIMSYEGLQYQHIAARVMEQDMLTYLEEHIRILSGFYGILRPFDGVTPYRLEMQASFSHCRTRFLKENLYKFWENDIMNALSEEQDCILDLASKEYSKILNRKKEPIKSVPYYSCIFGELNDNKIIEKGTNAKIARGKMVRYMSERKIKIIEDIKEFSELGYEFSEKDSSKKQFVFLK